MATEADYASTAQAFDAIAASYDEVYGPNGNAIMTWMRGESLVLLRATFPAGSRLLEIGCGTGDEAVCLALAGYTIVATDVSPAMVAQTQAKVQHAGVADRVATRTIAAGQLEQLQAGLFDGAYASFGSLNCEPELERLGAALETLLAPGGAFVCSVMARFSPFEVAWFGLHGQLRTATRRWRRGWQPVVVSGKDGVDVAIPVHYLTVGEVARAFAPAFVVERTMALGLLVPPPYLDHLSRHRWLFANLASLERRLRHARPWRYMGDHIALVLRKR